jgi:hypothetical protein
MAAAREGRRGAGPRVEGLPVLDTVGKGAETQVESQLSATGSDGVF